MADYPSLTVTALGNKGSGKTTFLLGMYAHLSAGASGYFLSADPDTDIRLADRWDKLLEDGELPPPNLADNITYEFRFLDGIKPLLAIDWLDYRGGALEEETGSASGDVAGLHERLKKSDCVYLVLDGGYLVEPVSHATLRGIMRRAGLRRMTLLVQTAVEARTAAKAPPPSLVVLVTKTDLIPPQRRNALEKDIRELLSLCFAEGFTTLICPVMLGRFGLNPDSRVDPRLIAPHNLHLPIIFALAEYMYQLSAGAQQASSASAQRYAALQRDLAALRAGAGPFFQRKKIAGTRHLLAEAARERETLSAVQRGAADRAATLFGELGGLQLFRDGIEVDR